MKGEEHLLIPAPPVLCYKHLGQLLSAAWLSGGLRVGSAASTDQGSREGQVVFQVNGKERTVLGGKQRITVVGRTLQRNEMS